MLKIGHRGAPGHPRVAENTIGSFQRAIWKGANALEFDVRRTKDGKLVVIHDLSVQRTTNGSGNVCDMTYKQLRELNAGFGERIPLLEDVLCLFGERVLLNTFALSVSAIQHWYRDVHINQKTQSIIKKLEGIVADSVKLADNFRKLGGHLSNAQSAYEDSEKRLGLMTERVSKVIRIGEAENEPEEIEAPKA